MPIASAEAPSVRVEEDDDGRPLRLVLRDGADDDAVLYPGTLARRRTAVWAYPLLPIALAVDAATNPILLFFAPAVIVLGD